MTATTSTPKREPLSVLATVYYDRERTDRDRERWERDPAVPFSEKYLAASDSCAGRRYDVQHYPETGAWKCNCPATVTCKHINRCARLRRVRWWSALLGGQPPHVLRAHLRHYQERDEAGYANEDDLCAIDFLTMRLDGEEAAA